MLIITYHEALSQNSQEIVNACRILFSFDSTNANRLLVDHLHDLPLLSVLGRSAVLGATEAITRCSSTILIVFLG